MPVLHPLPRIDEIKLDVDNDPRAAYFDQVHNGVRAGARGGFVTVMVPDLAPADDEMRSLYTAECRDLFEVKKLLEAGKL